MVRNVQRVSVMSPAMERDRIVRGDEPGFTTMRIYSRGNAAAPVGTNRSTDQLLKVLKGEREMRTFRNAETHRSWNLAHRHVLMIGLFAASGVNNISLTSKYIYYKYLF